VVQFFIFEDVCVVCRGVGKVFRGVEEDKEVRCGEMIGRGRHLDDLLVGSFSTEDYNVARVTSPRSTASRSLIRTSRIGALLIHRTSSAITDERRNRQSHRHSPSTEDIEVGRAREARTWTTVSFVCFVSSSSRIAFVSPLQRQVFPSFRVKLWLICKKQ